MNLFVLLFIYLIIYVFIDIFKYVILNKISFLVKYFSDFTDNSYNQEIFEH